MILKCLFGGANSRGDGVMLEVKKFYKTTPVPIILNRDPSIDLLCVKVYTSKTNFMSMILTYISFRSTIK